MHPGRGCGALRSSAWGASHLAGERWVPPDPPEERSRRKRLGAFPSERRCAFGSFGPRRSEVIWRRLLQTPAANRDRRLRGYGKCSATLRRSTFGSQPVVGASRTPGRAGMSRRPSTDRHHARRGATRQRARHERRDPHTVSRRADRPLRPTPQAAADRSSRQLPRVSGGAGRLHGGVCGRGWIALGRRTGVAMGHDSYGDRQDGVVRA